MRFQDLSPLIQSEIEFHRSELEISLTDIPWVIIVYDDPEESHTVLRISAYDVIKVEDISQSLYYILMDIDVTMCEHPNRKRVYCELWYPSNVGERKGRSEVQSYISLGYQERSQ